MANRCVAFEIRLQLHTEVCSLQTSPSASCASSFLQSQDNLASKIVRLLTYATVSLCVPVAGYPSCATLRLGYQKALGKRKKPLARCKRLLSLNYD